MYTTLNVNWQTILNLNNEKNKRISEDRLESNILVYFDEQTRSPIM